MSNIEYNNLLFDISRRLDELNVHGKLIFLCRNYLASGGEDIPDALSLFKALEERSYLGLDRMVVVKNLLKGVKEWPLFRKVKKFESKRKEYKDLLEQIIQVLDQLNDLERVLSICRVLIPEESRGDIHDVRSLFKELETSSLLEIDCLDVLREILTETEQHDLLKEVEEFDERRNREDEFESRIAQVSTMLSSVRSTLVGVLNLKNVFKMAAGGLIFFSTLDVFSRSSTFDERVTAVERCVLPTSTKLLAITDGCVCLTVQALNLTALNTLWSLYQNGTLKERLQTFFVTDEVRELAGGEDVEVIVTIEEQEYEKARTELTKSALGLDGWKQKESMTMQRRNSDSNLYCKARDGVEEQPEQLQPVTKQNKYIDLERLAYVQSYLKQAEDAESMTTETSDSGMPGTHGTPSEPGMEETRDYTYNPLCLKDLSTEMVVELTGRLKSDPVAQEWFHQAFGLDPKKIPEPRGLTDIDELFPYTPVRLLKDVFDALQLYDLVEILEKGKRQALRPALPLKEIGNIPNPSNRPSVLYSKVEVLIIGNSRSATADDEAKAFISFFKSIYSGSKIYLISAKSIRRKLDALKKLRNSPGKLERVEGHIELEEISREHFSYTAGNPTEEVNPTEQLTKGLQEDKERFQIALSAVFDKWIYNEDKKSTLFAIIECRTGVHYPLMNEINEMIKGCLLQKLPLIPDATKLVVTSVESQIEVIDIPEVLQVAYTGSGEIFASTMLELLSKRWQILDLISVMRELGRTLNFKQTPPPFYPRMAREVLHSSKYTIQIRDSLSCLPRLQKTEKNSNPPFNPLS